MSPLSASAYSKSRPHVQWISSSSLPHTMQNSSTASYARNRPQTAQRLVTAMPLSRAPAEPALGIDRLLGRRRSNLEMKVRLQFGVRHAHSADHVAAAHDAAGANGTGVERGVQRIVAAAMIEHHSEAIRPHRPDVDDGALRYRLDRRTEGPRDPDAIPSRRRIVRIDHPTKAIEDHAVDRP